METRTRKEKRKYFPSFANMASLVRDHKQGLLRPRKVGVYARHKYENNMLFFLFNSSVDVFHLKLAQMLASNVLNTPEAYQIELSNADE